MMSLKSKVVAGVVLGALSSTAYGRAELQCNKKQTKCMTAGHDLTIGDQVGVFNDDGELVAEGEVNAMRGERRAVLINKRHGQIRKGYDLALLSERSAGSEIGTSYKVYREPSKIAAGGSLGLGTWAIGESSPATELSVFGQMRRWGILLVGRGVYTAIEGEVSRYGDEDGIERQPISVSGFGLLGGVGYILRENKPISFRGEFGLGVMHVSADINGDASLLEDSEFDAKVSNGVGLYARAALGVMWNLGSWHVHADVAPSMAHDAYGTSIAGGVSKDMK